MPQQLTRYAKGDGSINSHDWKSRKAFWCSPKLNKTMSNVLENNCAMQSCVLFTLFFVDNTRVKQILGWVTA